MSLFKKSGGGFLNGVNAALAGYKWDETKWNEGTKDEYKTLSLELQIQQDGAAEPVSQFLQAGFLYDEHSISDDGLMVEGGDREVIGEDSEAGRFLQTVIERGFPEGDFNADESLGIRNLEALVGRRFTFGKELNKERQLAAGKKKLGKKAAGATEEELMLAGRRQDKTDKKKFYSLASAQAVAAKWGQHVYTCGKHWHLATHSLGAPR